MVGGLAEISAGVAPQVMVAGRNRTRGLNLVGLRREEKFRNLKFPSLRNCIVLF